MVNSNLGVSSSNVVSGSSSTVKLLTFNDHLERIGAASPFFDCFFRKANNYNKNRF